MIVFFDTDILIDVALGRQPHANASAQVLDLAEGRAFRSFIAWHSIANFYYIVTTDSGKGHARDFINDLLAFVEVAPTRTKDAVYATTLNSADFEDDLQIAAAVASRANVILTRNVKHYKKSPIQVLAPGSFLTRFPS